MKKWLVRLPVVCHVTAEVRAKSEEDAINEAFLSNLNFTKINSWTAVREIDSKECPYPRQATARQLIAG